MTTNATDTVVPLRLADDPRQAGAKAATLATLAAQGFPVPEGVVIPTAPFLRAVRASAEPSALAVPADVLAALRAATRPWGDVALAVRSSAVDEDLAAASYAGLYTSVLQVRGEEALADAVCRCWASAFTERVAAYAAAAGPARPELAVLVQPMVPAEVAGVAFTADPVTGERDVVVIDAVPGLADRLVEGAVTPERWTVRAGRAVRETRADAEVLDDALALAIADLARRVAHVRGTPQDIEWAAVGADVVLLQARPITALPESPVPVEVPVEVPDGYWVRELSHAPSPWTRLSHAILQARIPAIKAAVDEVGLLVGGLDWRDIGGLEYLRIVPLGGKQPPRLPGWAVPLAFRLIPMLRRRLRECVGAMRAGVPMRLVRRWTREWQPDLDRRVARLRDVDLGALDDDALDTHAAAVLALSDDGMTVHFRLHVALAMVLGELGFACRDLLGWDDQAWLRLVTGTSVMSTEPARALADLAARVAADPELRALVDDAAPVATVLAHDADFAARFADYLRRHGCRALSIELAEPALDERPELVLTLLRDQLAADYDPVALERDLATQRAEARSRARAALATRPEAERRRFDDALRCALEAYPVREDNEYFAISAPGALVRRTVLEIGRRLTRRSRLAEPADAFHLRPKELREALREDGPDLPELAARRAGERSWAMTHPGPPSYGTEPPPPPPMDALPTEARFANEAFLWTVERILTPAATASGADDEHLCGIAASPGTYTGAVRIIRDETEFDRIRAGDVLVCPMTSPVWSVLFPSVGALVTDAGGTLSHPAIIAREYGVPAVVATGAATTRLREGQLVTVDGSTGRVRTVS